MTHFSGVRSFGSLVEERKGLVVACADVRVFYQYNSPIRSQVLLLPFVVVVVSFVPFIIWGGHAHFLRQLRGCDAFSYL